VSYAETLQSFLETRVPKLEDATGLPQNSDAMSLA